MVALAIVLASASGTAAVGSGRPPSNIGVGQRSDATSSWLEGVDVSHWQNTIDWSKVAAAGKRFAIIKASEHSTYVDPLYASNRAAAQAAGLWTGAYHFARPDATAGDAVSEAAHFVTTIDLGPGDLIPTLDLETSGGLSTTALQSWVTTWLAEVTSRVGVRPMIYTSPAFWQRYMGDTRAFADAGYKVLWIAHWGVANPTVPASNWGGRGWTFWQYSSCGTVPGIVGCVDLDRYNGLDLSAQAASLFRLAATLPSGSLKQGTSSSALVDLIRQNFPSEIALEVSGLPAGTSATFDTNPSTAATAAMTVATASDPAATPVGTYPLTITGVAAGMTRTTSLNLVVADGIAPTLIAPVTRLLSGTTLGTATVPARVSWTASDPSGIASHGLQRSVNGGSWTGVALTSTATTTAAVTESLPLNATIQQRARATDRNTNTSPWAAGPRVRTLLSEQSAIAVTYTGTWRSVASTSASGGSVRYATSAGASATYRFTGSSVAWVAARGSSRGSARIYVDGVYATTISLVASAGQSKAIVFARNWGATESHTLKVVVVGTAGHPRVDVDAFVRLSL